MGASSSDGGSVPVPSKDPDAILPWERAGWEATHDVDGDPLGEGGWGIVRRVVHRASGERRALKHPVREDAEVRARFRREIEVQSRVAHRHVMPILEHDPEHRWFTMPLMDGTLLASARGMLDEEIARVVLQIARGLHAAHDKGYVHRDVKPSNIFLRSRLEPVDWVIGDFGLVRRPDGESTNLKTKSAIGTDGFMAPEAVLGEHGRVTPLADVYSLGRTIAWMTTGIRPEGLVPLSAREPWTRLGAQMTEFEPARRPNDMIDVIAGVEAVLRALRSERAKDWGRPADPAGALSPAEEVLLATVFDLASEPPGDVDGEIRVTWHDLSRELSSNRANLRVWLRKLVDLGYLRSAAGDQGTRCFTPTELAWDWAKQNEHRISAILTPPDRPAEPADEDLSF